MDRLGLGWQDWRADELDFERWGRDVTASIALVGDYSAAVVAHRAIPRALELCGPGVEWEWLTTSAVGDPARMLRDFTGVWLVPASPYRSMDGALAAVRFARETRRAFLGSCGGFQHALIEFARNVLGVTNADHAETVPGDRPLVVTPLACSLVEKSQHLTLTAGTVLQRAYGAGTTQEEYHCNYGINPEFADRFASRGLIFNAHDETGAIRGFELPIAQHPFFVGTLFQSERRALKDVCPPLVRAFVAAAARAPSRGS